jgi:hypothetical protein
MIAEILICAAMITAPACVANSPESQDWKGYEPSLYTGPHYDKKWAGVRKCIQYRESRYNYRARSSISTASGVYQFLDSQWRISLTYMMIKESKATRDGLIDEIKALRNKPINQWNRYYQDRAFFTVWDNGRGADHWNLTRHGC